MAAINARHIEGQKTPNKPYFFYNNDKNRFWQYMWQIFEKNEKPNTLSVQEKMDFCERWGVALCNLLGEMKIEKTEATNRTDQIIFKAHQNGLVKTKVVSADFKEALKTLPIFFTCYHKQELQKLLELFFKTNNLELHLIKNIHYLHTPAMPGRVDVLTLWKNEFQNVIKSLT